MATADELRAQLAALRQSVDRETQRHQQLIRDIDEARDEQDLRRQVEVVQGELARAESTSTRLRDRKWLIDQDYHGDTERRDGAAAQGYKPKPGLPTPSRQRVKTSTDIDSTVEHGELLWDIKGFSWLKSTAKQEHTDIAQSCSITVAGHKFMFLYHPDMGLVDEDRRGSLAIIHTEPEDYTGVTFRYKVFIKSSKRGFVQWGEAGDVCTLEDTDQMAFGPDVMFDDGEVPAGIFNMNHEELLTSEWVANDTLTAKLQVAVRPRFSDEVLAESSVEQEVQMKPPTIIEDILSLLDDATSSDVSFIVQGEPVRAHSQILSARSEVFRRMLTCGMREASSKEVVIEDCEPKLFQAVLRFLYSDRFDHLEEIIGSREHTSGSSESKADASEAKESSQERLQSLQSLLAVSHKYQLARLQAWSERALCGRISVEDVCPVLCQAHLYEAKQLEQVCLNFVKTRMHQIAKTASFGVLAREWPEVMMKISICTAGLPEDATEAASVAQQTTGKRKRGE